VIVINPAHAHRRKVGQKDNSEEAGRPPDPLPPTGCRAPVSILGVGCHFLRQTRDAQTNSRVLAAERSVLRFSLQRIQGTILLKVATLRRNRQKGVGFVEQPSNADAVGLHEWFYFVWVLPSKLAELAPHSSISFIHSMGKGISRAATAFSK